MNKSFRINKLADAEVLLPGFSKLWRALKAATGTRVRCPKSLSFTDEPRELLLNDDELGARFPLNLETLELGAKVRISAAGWRDARPNNDEKITGVPGNAAVLSCSWNDYHRCFSIEVQVAKLPAALEAEVA